MRRDALVVQVRTRRQRLQALQGEMAHAQSALHAQLSRVNPCWLLGGASVGGFLLGRATGLPHLPLYRMASALLLSAGQAGPGD